MDGKIPVHVQAEPLRDETQLPAPPKQRAAETSSHLTRSALSDTQTVGTRRSTRPAEVATPSGVLPSALSAARNAHKRKAGQPPEGKCEGTRVTQPWPDQDADMLCLSISDLAVSCELGAHADGDAVNWNEPDLEPQFLAFLKSDVKPIFSPGSPSKGAGICSR